MVLKICTPEARDAVRLFKVSFGSILIRERINDTSNQHKKNPRLQAAGFLISIMQFRLFQPTCNHLLHFLFLLLSQ